MGIKVMITQNTLLAEMWIVCLLMLAGCLVNHRQVSLPHMHTAAVYTRTHHQHKVGARLLDRTVRLGMNGFFWKPRYCIKVLLENNERLD